jgi:sporulation protein YlmC with PRC-barrel domain
MLPALRITTRSSGTEIAETDFAGFATRRNQSHQRAFPPYRQPDGENEAMSIRYRHPAIVALSALLAAPVLAQTATSPTAPSPSMTSPPTAMPSKMPSKMSSSTAPSSNNDTYVTADRQVRASKVIGSTVYNDQKQKIGTVEELLMTDNHDIASAVLSVGGFLGIDAKLVKVPYNRLHIAGDSIVMSGATKADLSNLPSYNYTGAS